MASLSMMLPRTTTEQVSQALQQFKAGVLEDLKKDRWVSSTGRPSIRRACLRLAYGLQHALAAAMQQGEGNAKSLPPQLEIRGTSAYELLRQHSGEHAASSKSCRSKAATVLLRSAAGQANQTAPRVYRPVDWR